MPADIKCDKCKAYFNFSETYCPQCISDLETENENLQKEVEDLKDEIGDLKNHIAELQRNT